MGRNIEIWSSKDKKRLFQMIRLPINFELYWGQFCALKIEAGPKKGPAPSEQTQPITNSYSLLHPGVEFSYF